MFVTLGPAFSFFFAVPCCAVQTVTVATVVHRPASATPGGVFLVFFGLGAVFVSLALLGLLLPRVAVGVSKPSDAIVLQPANEDPPALGREQSTTTKAAPTSEQ